MLTTSLITILSSAGVAFYLRFLVALLRDSASSLSRSQKRLPFGYRKETQSMCSRASVLPAALPIVELKIKYNLRPF